MIGPDVAALLHDIADHFEHATRGSVLWVGGLDELRELVTRIERESVDNVGEAGDNP